MLQGTHLEKNVKIGYLLQKEMRWTDIKERAATNTAWQWHIPSALNALRDECLKKDIWREHGGYIEKG